MVRSSLLTVNYSQALLTILVHEKLQPIRCVNLLIEGNPWLATSTRQNRYPGEGVHPRPLKLGWWMMNSCEWYQWLRMADHHHLKMIVIMVAQNYKLKIDSEFLITSQEKKTGKLITIIWKTTLLHNTVMLQFQPLFLAHVQVGPFPDNIERVMTHN